MYIKHEYTLKTILDYKLVPCIWMNSSRIFVYTFSSSWCHVIFHGSGFSCEYSWNVGWQEVGYVRGCNLECPTNSVCRDVYSMYVEYLNEQFHRWSQRVLGFSESAKCCTNCRPWLYPESSSELKLNTWLSTKFKNVLYYI